MLLARLVHRFLREHGYNAIYDFFKNAFDSSGTLTLYLRLKNFPSEMLTTKKESNTYYKI